MRSLNLNEEYPLKQFWQQLIEEIYFDDYVHPNQSQYPNQRLLVVQIQDYAYIVPYIQTGSELFLKTIIPSRKATKQYLRGDNNYE